MCVSVCVCVCLCSCICSYRCVFIHWNAWPHTPHNACKVHFSLTCPFLRRHLVSRYILQPRPTAAEGPVVLVLAPTRELIIQICDELGKYQMAGGLRIGLAYGGSDGAYVCGSVWLCIDYQSIGRVRKTINSVDGCQLLWINSVDAVLFFSLFTLLRWM